MSIGVHLWFPFFTPSLDNSFRLSYSWGYRSVDFDLKGTIAMNRWVSILIAFSMGLAFADAGPTGVFQRKAKIYHEGWIDLNKNGEKDPYENPALETESRISDLLSRKKPARWPPCRAMAGSSRTLFPPKRGKTKSGKTASPTSTNTSMDSGAGATLPRTTRIAAPPPLMPKR